MLKDDIKLSLSGVHCSKIAQLLEEYDSSTNILSLSKDDLADSGLNFKEATKIALISNDEIVDKELEFISKYNIRTLIYGTEEYPTNLSGCDDPPTVLYVKGETDFLANTDQWISIVGTRKCSDYSTSSTISIVEQIAEHYPNAVIVSGLAYGIDAVAHRAALACGLRTVGVLAHGLNKIYPSEHRDLAKNIISKGGALITEFTSQSVINKSSFLQRNRIIAGLSTATCMMESPLRGGSLATANLADSYNRDVFTLPARITDVSFEGNINLLRSSKANIITGLCDIEEIMGWVRESDNVGKPYTIPLLFILNDTEQSVFDIFVDYSEVTLDYVVEQLTLPVPTIISSLTSLEIKGAIRSIKGKMYVRVR